MRPFYRLAGTLALLFPLVAACGGGDTGTSASSAASVTLTFNHATLSLGDAQTVAAQFHDASGANISAPSGAKWTSSLPAIASVDKNGRVTALALGGPVTISVKAGDATGSVTFTVIPEKINFAPVSNILGVGNNVQITATPQDISGHPIGSATVSWTTSNQAVATVSNTGLVTGVAAGTVRITATSAGQTAFLDFEVGIISQYDGDWKGVNSNGSRPVDIVVVFGQVRSFTMTYYLFVAPYAATCQDQVVASGAPNAAITNGQFAFNLTSPPTASITGTFTNTTTITGTHTAMNLGSYSCDMLNTGQSTTKVTYTANIPAAAFTLTKQ
ncbi:MAG TPA: Ig-like domain-containing protein [Gemmatimonadaceae bacterium]|nr:Ig-like domain-containing protein [Gemmatimonadaceae bacterium]